MSKSLSSAKKPAEIVVILGPTASGKSDLAVKLALRLRSGQAKKFGIKGGEIISADSRQIYKGLDIGTEKISRKEMKGIKHHMLEVANPKKVYTVAQYQKTAKKILRQIFKKRKIPIIVGGSGFYIDALIYDYQLPAVAPQRNLRKKLNQKSTTELFQMLQGFDPRRAANIDFKNRRRLIRALEIIIKTGKHIPPLTKLIERPSNKFSKFDFLKIGIKKSPAELRRLINQRLKNTLKRGLIKEVKKLHPPTGGGLSWQRLEELGMEYRLASYFLRGLVSYPQMISQMQREIYRYAKRQMTWFKRDKSIKWIKNYQEAATLVKKFLLG